MFQLLASSVDKYTDMIVHFFSPMKFVLIINWTYN